MIDKEIIEHAKARLKAEPSKCACANCNEWRRVCQEVLALLSQLAPGQAEPPKELRYLGDEKHDAANCPVCNELSGKQAEPTKEIIEQAEEKFHEARRTVRAEGFEWGKVFEQQMNEGLALLDQIKQLAPQGAEPEYDHARDCRPKPWENDCKCGYLQRMRGEQAELAPKGPPAGEFTNELRAMANHTSNAAMGATYLDCADRLDAQQLLLEKAQTDLRILQTENKRLTTNACDRCGTRLIDNCVHCGAPQCCPLCCSQDRLDAQQKTIRELITENLQLRTMISELRTASSAQQKNREELTGPLKHAIAVASASADNENYLCQLSIKDANMAHDLIVAQQQEIECYKAMKEGVEIRIGDMQAEIDRLTAENAKLKEQNTLLAEELVRQMKKHEAQAERIEKLEGLLREAEPFVSKDFVSDDIGPKSLPSRIEQALQSSIENSQSQGQALK